MRIGSLCSGYGGLEMGLRSVVGGEVAWHVENDPAPSKILAYHWPHVPNYGDITTVDWTQVWEDTVMGAPRNDERAGAMYALYKTGKSLAEVADAFDCTRQSVYVIFKRRGWDLHPRPPGRLFELYRSERYTLRNNGYYAATTGNREYLHRQMWMDERGPIPDGYDIHHRDHDKTNNVLGNLECLPKDEHTKHHHRDSTEEVVPSDSPAVDWLTAGYP